MEQAFLYNILNKQNVHCAYSYEPKIPIMPFFNIIQKNLWPPSPPSFWTFGRQFKAFTRAFVKPLRIMQLIYMGLTTSPRPPPLFEQC